MKVKIIKHTGIEEAQRAVESTMRKGFESKANLDQIYRWMHSPMRTQLFEIALDDVYSYVSTHFVRHVTVVPFVTSKRTDRGGAGTEDRYTLVKTTIWANAEAIINMAQKRLCYQADMETWKVMFAIRSLMETVDPDLAKYMVPQCVFRGGVCCEPTPCGMYKIEPYDPVKIMERISG